MFKKYFHLMQRNVLLSHVKKHNMAQLPKERACELQNVNRNVSRTNWLVALEKMAQEGIYLYSFLLCVRY